MEYALYDGQRPVHYVNIGHFIGDAGWRHDPFQHQGDTEIILVLKGTLPLRVNHQDVYDLPAGSLFTVFPFDFIEGAAPVTTNIEFYWFHFVQYGGYSVGTARPTRDDHKTIVLPRRMTLTHPEQLVIMATQLLDLGHSDTARALSRDYLTTLLLTMITDEVQQSLHSPDYEESIVNQITEWIRVNMNQNMAVGRIAAHFNMSQDYLARLFKHATGTTIKGYLNQVKLDMARYLLLTTDLSVKEIAEHSYFADYKYFFRLFNKATHLTPAKYRNAFTRTFLNTPYVDPGFDVSRAVRKIESLQSNPAR